MEEVTKVAKRTKRRPKGRLIEKPRKKNDELLKGASEENFGDFLRFVFPDANDIIDFGKGFDFMDKELFAIIPDRERKNDKRVADLLAKVYLKDGAERWVLLNVEIEGGNDPDFPLRLYEYNYRIRDRYKKIVAAIVVFTGDEKQGRPSEYKNHLLGTTLSFKYLTYHILDHSSEELIAMKNPFALIVLACQTALLEGHLKDEELGDKRLGIAKTLLSYDYSHDRIISLLVFLKNFIFIDNKDINSKFDQIIYTLTGGTINMGIIETLKMQERRDGKLEGIEIGEARKGHDIVENLILELNLPDEQIARIAEVTIAFVEKVRKELETKK